LKRQIILPDYYFTVKGFGRTSAKAKGSEFIGTISPVDSQIAAEDYIKEIRKTFHDATHNCFAYRIDENTYRYSDDGEPSGTAGRPILSKLEKHDLQKVVLVVTRYFGGTKLGTGGLMRAYGDCAEQTIKSVKKVKRYNYQSARIAYPFALVNKIQHLVQKYGARIHEDASPEGMLAEIEVLPSRLSNFKNDLISSTAGKITFL